MPAEVETMFYEGAVPWHGLGKQVDHTLTAEEAIVSAGLDWEVELVPVFAGDRRIDNFNAIQRKTDKKIYTIVRNRYNPIQNREAFSFFDDVVGEGQAIYHTAGSLKDGARTWILAKLDDIGINGDQVEKYICLSNSHDGSTALQMFWTPIRVVCANTLAMAEGSTANRFYTRHTTNYKNRMELAREVLGLANRFYSTWVKKAEYLAQNQLAPAELPKLLVAAFGTTGAIKPQEVVDLDAIDLYGPVRRDMEVVERLFAGEGKGLDDPTIRGTKWAAFNAVTEYVDHYRKPKGRDKESSRLNSAWFGTGLGIKNRAWDYLLKN